MRRNRDKKHIEDEIINDWGFYTGQNKYWHIAKQNKDIKIQKVRIILKNISGSFSYRKFITRISAMDRCKNCMNCLRVMPCLKCYACKHINTKLCSRLICFYKPQNEIFGDP